MIFLKKKYFLNIGRLTKQKNQILLIKAFSKILDDNKDLNLVIVGEGEKRIYLERYIKNKNLEDKVFLIGHNKNVYPIIKNSIAIISTSLWEDPGAVMIEHLIVIKMLFHQIVQMDQRSFYLQEGGLPFRK